MTKEELKQETEVCMHNALFWLKLPISKENVEQGGTYIFKLLEPREKRIEELEQENVELRKIAESQQSSNISRHFENKKLKEGLAVGSTFNKALNSLNKTLEEERDKYRNMVFDKDDQLTKAKDLLAKWVELFKPKLEGYPITPIQEQTEQFLKELTK